MKSIIAFCIVFFISYAYSSEPIYVYEIQGLTSSQNGDLISRGFDVAAVMPRKFTHIFATANEIEKLKTLGYSGVIKREINSNIKGLDPAYTDYNELLTEMQRLASNYPGIAKLYDLGDPWVKTNNYKQYNQWYYQDYDIMGLKVSDNVNSDEDEPVLLIMALHHAREAMTVEVSVYAMQQLIEQYATNSEYKNWVDSYEIWFVPLLNPDGHNVSFNYHDNREKNQRKNLRDNNNNHKADFGSSANGLDGVDLNRNYSFEWSRGDNSQYSATYRGPYPFSEPEVQVIKTLTLSKKPVISVSLHSYSGLVLWPWGCYYSASTEAALLSKIGRESAVPMGYTPEQAVELYPCYGTSDDWLYAELGTYPYTIEMNTDNEGGFFPPAEMIEPTQKKVWSGLRAFFVNGLSTQVTGRAFLRGTGNPIKGVKVTIRELNDPNHWTPRKTNEFGRYRYLLVPGNYTLEAEYGANPKQTIPFTVADKEIKEIDFYFDYAGFKNNETAQKILPEALKLAPNPFRNELNISFNLSEKSDVLVEVFDMTGRLIKTLVKASYPSGNHGVRFNSSNMSNGIYIVKCRVADKIFVKKVLKIN